MSEPMTAAIDQWMQYYQQPLMDALALPPAAEGFSDATAVTASPTMSSDVILSPSNSYTSSGQLTPKGNVSKPIRRRSRASKRTPTTLLNANTTNFRALVQQFTGCPSTTMSFGVHKGPITLNFQQGSKQQIHPDTTTTIASFDNKNHDQVHQAASATLPWQRQQREHLHQQQLLQEQQRGYSFDDTKSSTFLSSTLGNLRPNVEASDGLLMDNDFSLHDMTMNAFSNDINDDGYFM